MVLGMAVVKDIKTVVLTDALQAQRAFKASLQLDVEEDDVLVVAVLHEEALRDAAQLCEAQALIEMQGMDVGSHDRIELHEAEAQSGAHSQRVFHKLFADVQPAFVRPDGIAGVGDVTASAHVVGVQDVETDKFARLTIHSDAGIGLAAEETVSLPLGQFLDLRERHAFTHHLVPNAHGLGHVLLLIFPDDNHTVQSVFSVHTTLGASHPGRGKT